MREESPTLKFVGTCEPSSFGQLTNRVLCLLRRSGSAMPIITSNFDPPPGGQFVGSIGAISRLFGLASGSLCPEYHRTDGSSSASSLFMSSFFSLSKR